MAAVILSATVCGDQYLKHPVTLLAFIWRIHRHTTGMSHKHVEAFFKDRRGGGGAKEEGSVVLTGLNTSHYCHLVFCNQEGRGGVRVKSPP